MLTFDEVGEALDDIAEQFPQALFRSLNGGVNLLEDAVEDPEFPGEELYIMGEYCDDCLGKYINLYYGSFAALAKQEDWSSEDWLDELWVTLSHELTHHMEGLGGLHALDDRDEEEMAEFRREYEERKKGGGIPVNIRYDRKAEALYILDQTLLPNEEREICLSTAEEMYDAIRTLKVRGAPAIGVCAGYCMYVLAKSIRGEDRQAFLKKLSDYGAYLSSSRPTAVNLDWAIRQMLRTALEHMDSPRGPLLDALYEKAVEIHQDDIAKCKAISEYGLSLLKDGDGLLTHCNAGPLATSRYGTALGPILLGTERGVRFRVFSDETRPLLQGARLTSYELQRSGVDVTLICDSMASVVMKNGWVNACLVGCDRVAANGDTANKIGTSGVAILAKHYGIPLYVLSPTSTIDMDCPDGAHIPIEERNPEEIRSLWYEKPMAPSEVKCYNPSFDVTDHELITAIVTEKGICRPPYAKSLAALFR